MRLDNPLNTTILMKMLFMYHLLFRMIHNSNSFQNNLEALE